MQWFVCWYMYFYQISFTRKNILRNGYNKNKTMTKTWKRNIVVHCWLTKKYIFLYFRFYITSSWILYRHVSLLLLIFFYLWKVSGINNSTPFLQLRQTYFIKYCFNLKQSNKLGVSWLIGKKCIKINYEVTLSN